MTVFSVAFAAPVTIHLDGGDLITVSPKSAFARGNGGGGNGGGGNGGGGNGGGGNGGGGNGGGDDTGGGGNGGGNAGGRDADVGGNTVDMNRDRNPILQTLFARGPKVTRAVFTTEIRNRSPQDDIRELHDPDQYVTFFTDLRKMNGTQVTHRWIYRDAVKYEMSFKVMSEQWQAWSTQRLPVDAPGEWTVEVIDENGNVLAAESLTYLAKAADGSAGNDAASGGFSGTVGKLRGLLNL